MGWSRVKQMGTGQIQRSKGEETLDKGNGNENGTRKSIFDIGPISPILDWYTKDADYRIIRPGLPNSAPGELLD